MAKNRHFKIGIFVIIALALLFTVVVIFAGAQLFTKTVPAETYFDESVVGLNKGAPVKYRGVSIGRVSAIEFIINKYPDSLQNSSKASRYVLVEMELNKDVVSQFLNSSDLEATLQEIVNSGLRVRLTTQGLTGVAYLEMNFFDPELNKPLPITWTPESLYFPSAPSTLSRVEAAVNSIGDVMHQFEDVDFKSLASSIDGFLTTLDGALQEADVKSIGALLVQNLVELRDTLSSINALVNHPKTATILPDASDAMASAKSMLQGSEENFTESMAKIQKITKNLETVSISLKKLLANPALQKSADKLPSTLHNAEKASEELRRGAAQLDRLLRNLNTLVTDQSPNIDVILDDTKTLIGNFNSFVDDVKDNPARLFFGEPPATINPETLQ